MKIDLDIQEMRTADLVPYAGNAKEHPQRQVEQIAASIEQFGFNDPVGIWHDADGRPVIVEGHGRVMAAQMLGMESVPVVTLDHLDDEGRRAYGIAHNATNMSSGFDDDALRAELAAISQIDMEAFGVDVSAVLEQVAQVPEDDAPEPENVSQRVTEGDAWRMGEHILVCGDATDPAVYARLFHDGERADMLLTDPPYNVDYASKNETLNLADKGNRIQTDIIGDKFESGDAYAAFIADALTAAGGRCERAARSTCGMRRGERGRCSRRAAARASRCARRSIGSSNSLCWGARTTNGRRSRACTVGGTAPRIGSRRRAPSAT